MRFDFDFLIAWASDGKMGVSSTCHAAVFVYAYTCICISIYTYLYMQIHVFVYVYTCTFCAYFGFNILIAWVGDGPWKDRLSPTCHRDSLPMASDQGIGLQAHLRLKCYPLRFVFVFLLQCLYIM